MPRTMARSIYRLIMLRSFSKKPFRAIIPSSTLRACVRARVRARWNFSIKSSRPPNPPGGAKVRAGFYETPCARARARAFDLSRPLMDIELRSESKSATYVPLPTNFRRQTSRFRSRALPPRRGRWLFSISSQPPPSPPIRTFAKGRDLIAVANSRLIHQDYRFTRESLGAIEHAPAIQRPAQGILYLI